MTDTEALETLVPFFLGGPEFSYHNGRYDLWLFLTDKFDVLSYLKSKVPRQEEVLVNDARMRAYVIKNSPLYKALL